MRVARRRRREGAFMVNWGTLQGSGRSSLAASGKYFDSARVEPACERRRLSRPLNQCPTHFPSTTVRFGALRSARLPRSKLRRLDFVKIFWHREQIPILDFLPFDEADFERQALLAAGFATQGGFEREQ